MLLVAYKKYILAPIVILANNPLLPKQVVISLREHEAESPVRVLPTEARRGTFAAEKKITQI